MNSRWWYSALFILLQLGKAVSPDNASVFSRRHQALIKLRGSSSLDKDAQIEGNSKPSNEATTKSIIQVPQSATNLLVAGVTISPIDPIIQQLPLSSPSTVPILVTKTRVISTTTTTTTTTTPATTPKLITFPSTTTTTTTTTTTALPATPFPSTASVIVLERKEFDDNQGFFSNEKEEFFEKFPNDGKFPLAHQPLKQERAIFVDPVEGQSNDGPVPPATVAPVQGVLGLVSSGHPPSIRPLHVLETPAEREEFKAEMARRQLNWRRIQFFTKQHITAVRLVRKRRLLEDGLQRPPP